jgi:hypothetical protein
VKGSQLAFPFRAAPLLLIGVFTVGLLIARLAGLLGMFLAILLISWFFKYCFVMLDAIVAGEEEPPVLSVEMVNPLSEQRPLAVALLMGLEFGLICLLHLRVGSVLSIPVAVLLLVTLPASLASVGLTGNPIGALWPGTWYAFVRSLGRDYLWLVLAMLIGSAAIYALWRSEAPSWITIATTQLLFLLIVAFIGSAIHEHRDELGIATLTRAERLAAREEREFLHLRKEALDRAYGLLRVQKSNEAWDEIDRWLRAHDARGANLPEYRQVFEAIVDWGDPRIGDRVAEELICLLLARRETGRAVEVCERWLAANPKFQPTQRARLAELSALGGKRALARKLA